MTDKMREGKLWSFVHDSLHEAYKKLSTTGTSNEYHALLDSIAAEIADGVDARFLQAAQSVPVVGEPVAWVVDKQIRHVNMSKSTEIGLGGANQQPLFLKPTTSITAQELDALRKDAERWRKLRAMDWFDSPFCVVRDPKGRISPGSDCPSGTRLDSFIDAIEDEKK